jgi:putative heme-binding domain-containing protein
VDAAVDAESRANAALALLKIDPETLDPVLRALAGLGSNPTEQERVAGALFNSRFTEARVDALRAAAGKLEAGPSTWADAALLKASSRRGNRRQRRSGAAEAAAVEIEAGWKDPARRTQILDAIALVRDNSRAEQVLAALEDADSGVKLAAKRAAHALNLKIERASEPKIADLEPGEVLGTILETRGEPSHGEQLFTQLGCVTCHTVDPAEAPKGPFLGNIAATYKRKELAEAVLTPNRSIAQGFAAWYFQLENGEEVEGFVVQEAADVVTIRNIAAQEIRLQTSDIASRAKLDKSLMPEGLVAALTVKEFASLVDYLENLGGQGK